MGYILGVRQVTYTRAALKVLRWMPANTAALIMAKVDEFAFDPASLANNVIRMKGRRDGAVRLRVGDWRVIIDDGVVLAVLDIGPRGGIYD